MIQVDQLQFTFDDKPLFDGLNFTINEGEIFSIIGPNGCGKSTLLRLLRGSIAPQQGNIRWNGTPVSSISSLSMARKVAVVPQTVHIDFPYKVHQVVEMGRYPHRKSLLSFSDQSDQQAVRHALAVTDIVNLAERTVTQLSGGELQRVFLARALAQSADVLFLDEATSHLDIDHRLELSELLVRLNREQGTTIVQISHDLDLASAMSDRIMLLSEHGEIVSIGTPDEVMTAEKLRQVFRVNVKVDKNPLTGTPLILPMINTSVHQLDQLKVHLICGGGSGKILLRKLHLANAQLSTGPLNQSDADESLATALDIPHTTEHPFCPYSDDVLRDSEKLIENTDVVVVSTRWWGSGNLACLQLASKALEQKKQLYLIGHTKGQDYTAGQAWKQIDQLIDDGAIVIDSEDQLMDALSLLAKASMA